MCACVQSETHAQKRKKVRMRAYTQAYQMSYIAHTDTQSGHTRTQNLHNRRRTYTPIVQK